jgi:hypothetical protein
MLLVMLHLQILWRICVSSLYASFGVPGEADLCAASSASASASKEFADVARFEIETLRRKETFS